MKDIGADFFCGRRLIIIWLWIFLFFMVTPIGSQEDHLNEATFQELVCNYLEEASDSNLADDEDEYEMAPVFSRQEYNHYISKLQTPPTPQRRDIPHLYSTENKARPTVPTPSNNANRPLYPKANCSAERESEEYTINFKDISVVQLITFISDIAGTNFIYNSRDLDGIEVTIVSKDPTSSNNLSAALLQILKMHGLSVIEEGNNVLIYKGQSMSRVSTVITNDNPNDACDKAIITRVFPLTNVDAVRIANIVRQMASPEAIVEPSSETRHLIVTDITANIHRISDLLAALDSSPDVKATPVIEEYHVNNADPESLAEYAREILKPLTNGATFSITAEKNSKTIFIVGTPYIIERAMRIFASLDVEGISSLTPPPPTPPPAEFIENNGFHMYKLKYTNGAEIAAALREIGTNLQATGSVNPDFINTIYSIQWIDVNNSIVITGTQDAIDKVIALINDLDKEPKQVYIEVLILDTTLTNSLDFGVQWIALGEEQNRLAFGTGLLSQSPPNPNLQAGARTVANTSGTGPGLPNPGNINVPPLAVPGQLVGALDPTAVEAFSLGFIGNIIRHNGRSFLTLGALISALDEEGDATVVLNPKIMVEDTQPADFFVGQNIPYQTTSTVIQQTGSVTQNIQYEDIGVELQVTPTISPNNMVTLQISQSVSDLNGLSPPGATNLTPVTNKTLSTTRVHVPDGTFLVMSGHVRDQCTYIRSGIPCLGTLPLIGPLFGRTIEQRIKRNLIFFIRPKVVTNIQQGLDLTNEEGYDYNWNTNPCSIINSCCPDAPECEIYPSPNWPLSEGRKEDADDISKTISSWSTTKTGNTTTNAPVTPNHMVAPTH